jgi:hypothetical protein
MTTPKQKHIAGAHGADQAAAPAAPAVTPAQRTRLLSRVAGFYHQTFLDTPEGLTYLSQTHGIRDVSLFKTFQIGFSSGSLLTVLPEDGETVLLLKALGVLDAQGREFFRDCVVFPLWSAEGVIVNLAGRCIENGEDRYLSGEPQGLWNGAACRRSGDVLLVPSLLDALAAVDSGFADVLPCSGADGLNGCELAALQAGPVQRAALAFGHSAAGDRVLAQLAAIGVSAASVALPAGQDLNRYLREQGEDGRLGLRQELARVFARLTPAAKASPSVAAPVGVGGERQSTAHGFRLHLQGRHYEVKGIARETIQLKATVKTTGDAAKGFELTTLDLYSARSREAFVKRCAVLFAQPEKLITADFARLIEEVEAWQPLAQPELPAAPLSSPADEARGLAFLNNPKLFEELLDDLRILGVAGEETNKLVSYLAAVSRKLDDPLSLMIQSRSAAGKSTLQHAVLSLTPPEDQVHYTRLTSQSLFYQDEMHLAHKVLALEEAEGLGEAAYSLRALQSAKRITLATTVKDPLTGKMKTDAYTVQGPVAVLLTTTSASLDEETASRFLTLTIDESKDMTETILATQRRRDTLEGYLAELAGDEVIAKHHAAQRLLEPLVVINPYAEQLSFPAHSLRARRDHKKYLMLIKAVTFLHQKQRTVKESARGEHRFRYVEVSRADIALANTLAQRILGHSLDELTAQARTLLGLVHRMVSDACAARDLAPSQYFFTRRDIRQATGWSDWQVRMHVKELETLEYLRARTGAWGREYVYELSWGGDPETQAGAITLADPQTLPEPA